MKIEVPADPEIYKKLLIPDETQAFIGKLVERQPGYFIGPVKSGTESKWTSPITKERMDSRNEAIHGVGMRLWSNDNRGTPNRDKALVAVADPLACLITLVWRAGEKTCSGDHLERCLHHFYRELHRFETWLAQSPGLQLVIVGDKDQSEFLSMLQEAYQNTMRRIGDAAVDVQVRWIYWNGNEEKLLKRILTAHGPMPIRQKVVPCDDLPSPGEVQGITEKMKNMSSAIPELDDEQDNRVWDWDVIQRLMENVQTHFPHALRYALAVKKNAAIPPTSGTSSESEHKSLSVSIMGIRIAVRRFCFRPLSLPLAPVTLLSSENASGKTTVIESLCQLFLHRPRVRLWLPYKADDWDQDSQDPCYYPSRTKAAPKLEALLISEHETGSDPNPSANNIDTANFLALFADDARLDQGAIGETALLTLWPLHGTDKLFESLRTLSEQEKLISKLEKWLNYLPTLTERKKLSAKDELQLPPGICKELRGYLQTYKEEKEGASDELVKLDQQLNNESYKNKVKQATKVCLESVLKKFVEIKKNEFVNGPIEDLENLVQKFLKERGIIGELQEDLEAYKNNLLKLDESHNLSIPKELVQNNLKSFLEHLQDNNYSPSWIEVRELDKGLGGDEDLRDFVRRFLERRTRELAQNLETYFESLENLFTKKNDDIANLEQQLHGYFDTDLVLPCETEGNPPRSNTAKQVRNALIIRLSRWLCVGGADFPILMVDEPVLGQDASSAAASLGRFLRLRRKAEAIRWARYQQSIENDTKNNNRDQSTLYLKIWPNAHGKNPQDLVSTPIQGPLPPQIIITSHQSSALAAAAEMEGVVLDLDLQHQLLQLLPVQWWEPLRSALRDSRDGFLQHITTIGIEKLPAHTLRIWWEMPNEILACEKLEKGNCYLEGVKAALSKLGLSTLKAEIDDEIEKRHPLHDYKKNDEIDELAAQLARRSLQWLMITDLLPALLSDAEAVFEVSGVTTRELPAVGGFVPEKGPARLRRIGTWQEFLPPDPRPIAKTPAVMAKPEVERPTVAKKLGKSEVWYVYAAPADSELTRAVTAAGLLPTDHRDQANLQIVRCEHKDPQADPHQFIWQISNAQSRPLETGSSQPVLSERLVDLRLHALSLELGKDAPVAIAIWTYELSIPDYEVAFIIGHKRVDPSESEWKEKTLKLWHERIATPLSLLRRKLDISPEMKKIRLYPFCHLGAAIRAGAIFLHTTPFSLECVQNNIIWDLHRQPAYQQPPINRDLPEQLKDLPVDDSSDELHLLLSFSQPVAGEYFKWRRSDKPKPPQILLHLQPQDGPSRFSISEETVTDWGEAVFQQISRARTPETKSIRIFCAAPVALAIAIGRSLNTGGRIITMDFDKDQRSYFESFDFNS